MNNDNYLRTPRERIVIGELTETSNGVPALKIKKPNKDIYDYITLPKLINILSDKLDEKGR